VEEVLENVKARKRKRIRLEVQNKAARFHASDFYPNVDQEFDSKDAATWVPGQLFEARNKAYADAARSLSRQMEKLLETCQLLARFHNRPTIPTVVHKFSEEEVAKAMACLTACQNDAPAGASKEIAFEEAFDE
jgi:hypothetical protein